MISLNDVLLAMSNIPVDDPIAEIWGRGLQGGYKIIEYTGTLPITINANGDALLDYRIYGTDGGVGVATENLFDKNSALLNSTINSITGRVDSSSIGRFVSDYIKVNKDDNFTIVNGNNNDYFWFYDINKRYTTIYSNDHTFIANQDGYIRISNNADIDKVMLIKGSTAPTNYIPYGYKLPMTIGDGNTAQSVPVYIGENQLTEGEYVSYGEQKIYRDVDGTLTPTDPPVSLPQIPTIDGTTIIDYDGDPKPSQMYVKYKGKG